MLQGYFETQHKAGIITSKTFELCCSTETLLQNIKKKEKQTSFSEKKGTETDLVLQEQ